MRAYGIGTVIENQHISHLPLVKNQSTHSSHAEIARNTPSLSSSNTSVADLGGTGITVHLRELKLCLGARALRERCVADEVAKSLSIP